MFQLRRAVTASIKQRAPWPGGDYLAPAPPVEVDFCKFNRIGIQSAFSIVIGSNGRGKSRLLGGIADAFRQLSARSPRLGARFPLDELSYFYQNERVDIVRPDTGRLKIELNGRKVGIEDIPLPRRVVATTMTPFDKFPLDNNDRAISSDPQPIYHYLGLRDRTNRASPTTLLYRAIENLLARRDHGERSRIIEVFNLLGYAPTLTLRMRLDLSEDVRNRIAHDSDWGPEQVGRTYYRVARAIERGDFDWDQFRLAVFLASDLAEYEQRKRYIQIKIDFSKDYCKEAQRFAQLQILRRYGLMRILAADVQRADGVELDLKAASSGELNFAVSFLSIASALANESLVLIDEPEISLHPEWQASYIDLLRRTFSGFEECHYVLATHSPIIVSDVPENATVISLDKDEPIAGEEVAGKSSDYLLVRAFDAPIGNNYFVQEQVVKALRLAADGEIETPEFAKTVNELEEISEHMKGGDAVKELIGELAQARDEVVLAQ
jgi:predicted ATPase